MAAAGLISAEALGLPAAAPVTLPNANIVPGDRINLPDLAEKTLASLKESTRGTYRSYINFLVQGWALEAPPEEKVYPGLAAKYQRADEVLSSELDRAARDRGPGAGQRRRQGGQPARCRPPATRGP